MAWWDSNSPRSSRNGSSPLRLSKSRKDLALGDAFPKLDFTSILPPNNMPATADPGLSSAMDHDRIILSPISEEHFSPPPIAPLTVHVTIQFTDPVIRSRYSRSYTSSHTFEPTNRICNGLLRRIQLCSEELLTRKDSTALDQYKDGTYERKAMRFEITFRIVRRGYGEWAERTFRSYQKQPLTVGLTKDIQLATHRIVGLFLRRYDKNFQWLDGSIVDHSPEAPETALPSSDARLSLLCVPRSRFIEATQSFEFVPGYTIQLSFRSRNPRRALPVFKRTIKVESTQPAPLSLLMSEEIQWKGLEAINRDLEDKKRELYNHMGVCQAADCPHSDDDALQIELSISNNLGTLHHVHREIKSHFSLFRDPEAKDCDDFLRSIQNALVEARDNTDSQIDKIDDFEFNVVELRGRTWSVRSPLRFSQGPLASYGRRTIQAALDRIQTGIGDVLRGNHVAVHITARKRGHLILDKAIISREKRGRPTEIFSSAEEQRTAFITRLKMRIERDIDMVFRDTCSIEDIGDDEEDVIQHLSLGPEAGYLQARSGSIRSASPASPANSTRRSAHSNIDSLPGSPTKRPLQRSFSLGHRSVSSAASVVSAKNLDDFRSVDMISESSSRRSSLSMQESPLGDRLLGEASALIPPSPTKPQRRFSLMPRASSSSTRVSSASTLICETPSLLEESAEIEISRDESTKGEIVKAVLLDLDKVPETDGIPPSREAISMTLNEVANANTTDSAGMVPVQVLESPARDLSSNPLSDAEVMAEKVDQSSLKLEEEEDMTKQQCGSADERLIPAGESEATDEAGNTQKATVMDAFQDAQEYSTAGLALHAASLAAKDGLTSPGIDEYSTAPSTPALSLGAESSPRHSLLATPSSYLRRGEGEEPLFSGAKGEEGEKGNNPGANIEPESPETESGTETTDPTETITDASDHFQSDSNESEDHLSLGDSIESVTEQSPPAPEVDMEQDGTEATGIDNKSNGPDETGPDNQLPVESLLSDTAPEVADVGEILPDEPVPSDTKPPAEPTASEDVACSTDETNAPDTNAANKQETQVDQHIYNETQNLGAEGVRSGADLADLADPDFPTQNLRSDPAPVSGPGEDISGANLVSDKTEDGTEEEKSRDAVVGVDSDANPFVVLDNEVAAPGDVPEDRSGSDELEPSYAEVASKVKDRVPETTVDISASESLPDSRKDRFPEESFVNPTGSAVDAIEAELAEAVGIDEHTHPTEETDKPEPQPNETEAPEKPTSDSAVQLSPEAEPDAAEADEDGRLHSNINADDHSILKHSPAAALDGEAPAPASAAVDPDTYPDDIGPAEVAQLQARLGEDYELGECNSEPLDENKSNGRDFSGVIVGVLDQNIGTDPDSAVVFSDVVGDDLQHQRQERVSSRRASELEEDICGHEYLTGSNRVGYAAVCLAGSEPDGVDEAGPDASTVPEALAEGDRHDKDVPISTLDQNFSDTDAEVPVAPDAILSSQVDEVPPVVVEVIKHILTGDSAQASEPEQTGPSEVDGQTSAASEKDVPPEEADVSTGVLHTEDTEPTPAIVTVITGGNQVPESEVSLIETEDGLPEITENPPDVIVDVIKHVLTGEFDSGDQEKTDLASELQGDERGQIDEERPIAVPETFEPVPAVVIVADENEKQVPESDEANNLPTEITEAPAAVITVLQTGPEITPSTEAKLHDDLSGSLPTLIPVAVPDISKHVRHIATEPSMSGAGEVRPENISVSVKDFESTGPSAPKARTLAPENGPEPTGLWVDEEAETSRATRDDVDDGTRIKTPFFFAPVAPISVQSGDSSSSSTVPIPDSEWDTVGISSRGSVDTIRRSFEEYESELDEPQNQPQTAGYLGLGDAHRKIKVGLGVLGKGGRDGDATRRPRGDLRRYSLPLQYLLDGEQDQNGAASAGKGKGKSSPRTTWSKLMGVKVEGEEDQELEHERAHHHQHHKKRAEEDGKEHGHHHHQHEKKEESSFLGEAHSAEQAIHDGPTVVPRMMMLLAGVVAVGKIIKGPIGHY